MVSDPVLNQYLADIESGAYTKEEAYQKALAEGASSEEARDKAVSAAETEVLYTSGPTRQSPVPMSRLHVQVHRLGRRPGGGRGEHEHHLHLHRLHPRGGWGKAINCSKRAGHGTQT